MNKGKAKKRRVYGAGEIVWLVILFGLAAMIIYPLFWILMSSFKDYQGIYGDMWGLPGVWHVENYMTAWNKGISQYFINSAIVTLATIAGVVFTAFFFRGFWHLPAYGTFGKRDFPFVHVRSAAVASGVPSALVYAPSDAEA